MKTLKQSQHHEQNQKKEYDKNTISSTPKIDQLFASMKYYSPTKKKDQKQMIDNIRQIGQQILNENWKLNKQSQEDQESFENIVFDSDGELLNQDYSKEVLFGRNLNKNLFNKNQKNDYRSKIFTEVIPVKPAKNLYDKYKQDFINQRQKKIINRTQQIVKTVNNMNKTKKEISYLNEHQKNMNKNVSKRLYDKNQVNSLNYQKFVQRKVKQVRNQTGMYLSKKTSFVNSSNKKSNLATSRQHQQRQLIMLTNRSFEQKPNQQKNQNSNSKQLFKIPQKDIFKRGQQFKMLKQNKRMKLITQKQQLQLQGHTFYPQKIAKKQLRKDVSKQQRQRISSLRKQIRDQKTLQQILDKSPFIPKIHQTYINQQDQMVSSKIKSLWSNSMESLPRYQDKDRDRSNKNYQSSTFANQRSIYASGVLSVKNPSQLKFLFN